MDESSDARVDSATSSAGGGPVPGPCPDEVRLLAKLRQRDEAAFAQLVDTYHNALLRFAMIYTASRVVAEEVVQETWLGVLQGVDRFEGRSSLKTWIYRILMNRAKTKSVREGRSIPFSQLFDADSDAGEPAVDPERFLPPNHPDWPGHWSAPPESWGGDPEKLLMSNETQDFLRQAVAELPASQREVITLRDIEQWESDEVCNALGISETNQRVLLHRARSRVRKALEKRFGARSKGRD
jgi:RNA polymerase sigma-70 factor (ECF subfamily)